jgi:hypothetical protein
MLHGIAIAPQHCPKSARVSQSHQLTVCKQQIKMVVLCTWRRSGQYAQASAHAQMKN